MGIFDSLHIGYTGLNTSQSAINTTSHNISNANTPGYTRQRVIQEANPPIHQIPGDVGNGVQVKAIVRIHDEFVYERMTKAASNLEYHQYKRDTLQEVSGYLPDLEDVGISKELRDFFTAWSNVAQNPGDDAQKIVLAQSMDTLAKSLNDTSGKLQSLQERLNDDLVFHIDEVNRLAEQIADLNKNINKIEGDGRSNANDLRDQRDKLELALSKLVNISVYKGNLTTDMTVDRQMTDQGKNYYLNVGGYALVDGTTFHPLSAQDSDSRYRFNSVYYENENGEQVDITDKIRGGKVGAIVALRGSRFNSTLERPDGSIIQKYINDLDTFTKTLTRSVNGLYAQSPQKELRTDPFENFSATDRLINYDTIREGSFDLVVYDHNGEVAARRTITIDGDTTLDDGTPSSIVGQINANMDDNQDNDGSNDLDDLFRAEMTDGVLRIVPQDPQGDYLIAMEDHGSRFAGVTGVHKLFEGDLASNVRLRSDLAENPAKIQPYISPIDGNNELASKMVALQYERIDFVRYDGSEVNQTIEGFYRFSAAIVATDGEQAQRDSDAAEVLNNTVTEEYNAVSGVDLDEELVNLMKYQTAYQASAKIITTIDRMVDTLLGMKQ